MQDFWKYGEKRALAEYLKMRPQTLNNILSRRRGVSMPMAVRLAEASVKILGKDREITWVTWIANQSTRHIAFRPLKVAMPEQYKRPLVMHKMADTKRKTGK